MIGNILPTHIQTVDTQRTKIQTRSTSHQISLDADFINMITELLWALYFYFRIPQNNKNVSYDIVIFFTIIFTHLLIL